MNMVAVGEEVDWEVGWVQIVRLSLRKDLPDSRREENGSSQNKDIELVQNNKAKCKHTVHYCSKNAITTNLNIATILTTKKNQ